MKTQIRSSEFDFHELAYHFLSLNATDRYLRFGRVSSDLEIVAYADSLLGRGECVFAVAEPAPSVTGVLHLEMSDGGAYLGLSVSDWARRRGIGTALLGQAAYVASSRDIRVFRVRNLNANFALRNLAHQVGMNVAWTPATGPAQLDPPDRGVSHGDVQYIAGRIALVDHSLGLSRSVQPERVSDCVDLLDATVAG